MGPIAMTKSKNPLCDPEVIAERKAGLEEAWANQAIEGMHIKPEHKDFMLGLVEKGYSEGQIRAAINELFKRHFNV